MSVLKTMLHKLRLPVEHNDWIIGLSGGVDSVVLFDLCTKFNELNDHKFRLFPVHLNHQTRGKDSDNDEQLSIKIGHDAGVEVTTKRLDITGIADASNMNFEETARIERHKLFYEVAGKMNLIRPAVLLAQHNNDNIETILMRLLRGSGLRGLHGIQYKSLLPSYSIDSDIELTTYRPLLDFSKDEIISYAIKNNLEWREDSSNQNTDYTRNLLRQVIIPALHSIDKDTDCKLLELSQLSHNVEQNIQSQQNGIQYKSNRFRIEIDVNSARTVSFPAFCRVVENLCNRLQPSFLLPKQSYANLQELFEGNTKGTDIAANLHIYEYNNLFHIFTKGEEVASLTYTADADDFDYDCKTYSISITRQKLTGTIPTQSNPNKEYIPISFCNSKLKLTLPQSADKFTPIGLSGTQKLSKILKNHRIPTHLRSKTPVLYAGNTPLWIVGVTLCDQAKLTTTTGEVFCLEYSEKTF